MFTKKFTIPATVPVDSVTAGLNSAVAEFAGIVKFTVRVPFENFVIGSSAGTSALDVKVMINCPLSWLGEGAERVRPTFDVAAGLIDAGTPVLNVGSGGSIAKT